MNMKKQTKKNQGKKWNKVNWRVLHLKSIEVLKREYEPRRNNLKSKKKKVKGEPQISQPRREKIKTTCK